MLCDSETSILPIFLYPKFKCFRLTAGGDLDLRRLDNLSVTVCVMNAASFFLFPAMSEVNWWCASTKSGILILSPLMHHFLASSDRAKYPTQEAVAVPMPDGSVIFRWFEGTILYTALTQPS